MSDLMFLIDGKKTPTLNPVTGCCFGCVYCYARTLIENRLKNSPKYKDCCFTPCFHERILEKRIPGKDKVFFVCSLGDLFGNWVPDEWILRVFEWCKAADPSNTFLFLTKNPARYLQMDCIHNNPDVPKNFVFGATIETNIDNLAKRYSIHAPLVSERYLAMKALKKARKFVVHEPIFNFDVTLAKWDREIQPEFIFVGYENHGKVKPEDEPPVERTRYFLVNGLKDCTEVRLKTMREDVDG